MKRGAESNQKRASKKPKVINYNSAMRKVAKGDYAEFQEFLNQNNSSIYELTFHEKSTKKERFAILEHFAQAICGTPVIELIVNNYLFKEIDTLSEEDFIASLGKTKIQTITYKDFIRPICNSREEANQTKFDKLIALSKAPSSCLSSLEIFIHRDAMLSKNILLSLADSKLETLRSEFNISKYGQAEALALAIKLSSIKFLEIKDENYVLNDNAGTLAIINLIAGLNGSRLQSLRMPNFMLPISGAIKLIGELVNTNITDLEISIVNQTTSNHLNFQNSIAMSENELNDLIETLKKSSLQKLTIWGDFDQEHVARILDALKDSPTLREIELQSDRIDPQKIISIASSIQSGNYTSVGLSHCKFDLESIKQFSQSIYRLKKLKLSHCTYMRAEAIDDLAMGVMAFGGFVGNPESCKLLSLLFQGICNSSIQYLSLNGHNTVGLSLDESDSLMQILKRSQVTRLNLEIFNPSEEAIKDFNLQSNIHRTSFKTHEVDPHDNLILRDRRWTSTLVPYYLQKAATKVIDNESLACPLQADEYHYDASKYMQRKDIASEIKAAPKHKRLHETVFSVELFIALGRMGVVDVQKLILGFLPSMNIEHTLKFIPKSIVHSTLGITEHSKDIADAQMELDAARERLVVAQKDMLSAYSKFAQTKNNKHQEQQNNFRTLFKF